MLQSSSVGKYYLGKEIAINVSPFNVVSTKHRVGLHTNTDPVAEGCLAHFQQVS